MTAAAMGMGASRVAVVEMQMARMGVGAGKIAMAAPVRAGQVEVD